MKIHKPFWLILIIACLTININTQAQTLKTPKTPQTPSTNEEDEKTVRSIFDESLINAQAYERLRVLCKDIGPRLSGSVGADKAVEWAVKEMQTLGFDTVYKQACMVPHWERGEKEYVAVHTNLSEAIELKACALGYSLGTPPEGIKGKVVKVNGIEDVEAMGPNELEGKIIYYSRPMDPTHIETFHAYGGCVDQRSRGAITAQQKGAIGAIVRSMGLRIDDYPHTGTMDYGSELPDIPSCAISTKASEDLNKMLLEDADLEIEMRMSCQRLPDKQSYNVIGEKWGSDFKDEYIVVGGHLDCWDNGEGAHDDGAGVVQSIEVLNLFKTLAIDNKHTLRAVLFMNEENGTRGARKYAEEVKAKNEKHVIAIESDSGGFVPRGFNVDGTEEAIPQILKQIGGWEGLLEPYNLHRYKRGYGGVDINFLKDQQIPLMGFYPDPQRYFDIHHTELDVFEQVNQRELVLGAASIASLVYLIDKYGLGFAPYYKSIKELNEPKG